MANLTVGASGANFATISAAVAAASAGDTIQIAAGTYAESVSISKALTFVGAGAGLTIVTPPSGSGFSIGGTIGATETIAISGISFAGSPNGSGVALADTAVLGALEIRDSAFTGNFRNGLAIGGGGPVGLGAVVVEDSVFVGNGGNPGSQTSAGDGDLLFFQYNGDATLRNLTITGQIVGSGPAENGIQFRADTGALGTVVIENVTISGVYEKQPIAFFNYDDVTGLTTTNVVVTADSTAFALSGNFDGIGGDFGIGGIDATGAPDPLALQGDASSQRIDGGAENTILRGGAGNDTLDGGEGFDTAVYAGARGDYTLATATDAAGFVTAFTGVADDVAAGLDEGADALDGVEALIFLNNSATPADDLVLDLARPVQVFDAADRLIGTFATIQAGVNAAPVDGTVRVAAGVFQEQVTISGKTGLAITGAGDDTVILLPASPVASGGATANVVVVNSSDIAIRNVKIDGDGRAADVNGYGIHVVNSGATIDAVAVAGVTQTPINGVQTGRGIRVDNNDGAARTVAITDSVFTAFQKTAIDARGAGLTVSITGNTITGAGFLSGTSAIAQNGVTIVGTGSGDGPTGVISGNAISEIGYERGVAVTAGILLFGAGSGFVIDGNTISGTDEDSNSVGIAVDGGDDATVSNNAIDNVLTGVRFNDFFGSTVETPTIFGNTFTDMLASFAPIDGTNAGSPVAGLDIDFDGDAGALPVDLGGSDGPDLFQGTPEGDALDGGGGDDALDGRTGNDTLTGGGGSDSIDGGGGVDTAAYAGAYADFAITLGAGALTVADSDAVAGGDEGVDDLTGVERLDFADRTALIVGAGGFATIQAAIDAASAGDTILIAAGSYAENLTIDKALTIVGAGAGATVVAAAAGTAVTLAAGLDGAATLEGLTLQGSGTAARGVSVAPGANATLTLRDAAVAGFSTFGLYSSDNGQPATTPGLTALTVQAVAFSNNGFGGANGAGHIKLFGFDGDATIADVTIAGGDAVVAVAARPDNAIEIVGNIVSEATANPAPANPPAIGAVILDGVTVTGTYNKNAVALFQFSDLAGLSIPDLDLSGVVRTGAAGEWGPAFNIDGVTGDIDASGFGILYPAGLAIAAELQGEKQGPGNAGQQGGPFSQAITGSEANELLNGKQGDDTLTAGDGDDLLNGGAGADALDGGDGFDTAVYAGARGDYTLATTTDAAGFVTAFTGVADDVAAGLDEGADALDGVEALIFLNNSATPADDLVLDLARPVQVFDAADRLIGTFATIQAGVNAAPVDGTVRVAAGTYVEAVTVSTAGLSILGANVGVIAHEGGAANPDRAAEATVTGGFRIGADGVTVDGFEIAGGTEAVRALNAGQSIDDLTIANLLIRDTTGSPIRFGLGFGGGLDSQNWTITGNLIDGIAGSSLTGMVLFNVDGLTVGDNVILHEDPAFAGRRGINLDGVRNAQITGNEVRLGLSQLIAETPAQNEAPWAIQISLSDRSVENVLIDGNTLQGARFGVVGLSQRSLTGLEVTGNTISAVINGVALNAGGVAPVVGDPVQSDILIAGNAIDATIFAVRLRDLHDAAVNGPVVFQAVEIGANAIASGVVQLGETDPAFGDRVDIAGGVSVIGSDSAGLVKVEGEGELGFIGGADDDTVLGGAGDDTVNAGGGNDSVDGGGGLDVAVFSGAFADFAITRNGALTVADLSPSAAGDEGVDALDAVETLRFADQDRRVFFGVDDAGIGIENLPTFIDILANDGDSNGDGATTGADVALALNSVRLLDADTASGKIKTVPGQGVWTVAAIGPGGRDVLIFQPETSFFGQPAPVFYTVAGADGVLSLATRVTLDVANINDAPAVTAPATATLAEDGALAFAGGLAVSVLDVDDDALTATLSVSEGVLSVTAGGSASVSGNGTSLVTITGTQAGINAALGGLVYAPADDFSGSDALTVLVSDGVLSDDAQVAIAVTPVNDAPVNTAPIGPLVTNEDTALSLGGAVSVADVDSGSLQTTLTVTRGVLTVATGGSATVTGNGTATVTVSGTQTAINAALAGLTYAPGANLFGADSLTVGTTDGALTDVDVVAITVNAVNDAPTVAAASAQNITAAGGVSATVTVTYADIDGVINVGSLGVGDIVVTGPNGPLLVTGLSVSPAGNGTPRTVSYVVAAPGGAWDAADEGAYTVALAAGEVFDLEGLSAGANAALTGFTVAIAPPPPPPTVRIEAETLALSGSFVVQTRASASGGGNIETRGTVAGTATLVFSGADGLYDIDLGYFDESDGVASLRVLVNGTEVDTFLWNANTGFANPVGGALVERSLSDIALRDGDVVTLVGTGATGEPTRTDYLDFTRTGDLPPPPVETFRVEAEAFALSGGFVIRSRGAASGGANIEVTGPSATGTATLVFSGEDGLYDIDLGYFDENDGVASLRVLINGTEVDNFLWNGNTGVATPVAGALVERRLEDIALRDGDVVTLVGTGATGEPTRTDYLDFTRTGDLPPPPVETFRVEAEAFDLSGGFVIRSRGAASGGANIEVTGPSATGTATLVFSGEDGLYDIDLGYFDENDGVASLRVLVNGTEVENFLWNANTGVATPVAGALVERRLEDIALRDGDVVTLVGTGATGEPARTDYLDFTRTGDLIV